LSAPVTRLSGVGPTPCKASRRWAADTKALWLVQETRVMHDACFVAIA
jgi:hypothetical protein